MPATEILENSHLYVIQTVDDLPEPMWDLPGVSGEWSAKDVLAHLISYELLLIDALGTIHGEEPSPYLLRWRSSAEDFATAAVNARRYHTAQQVINEYQDVMLQSTAMLSELPADLLQKPGTLSWYATGTASVADLIDLITTHVRQHCEEIIHFRQKNQALE
jgi:hypothetical protein